MWWLHGNIEDAKLLVLNALDEFPEDQTLLSTSVHLSLAEGNLDLAESLLPRLEKVVGREDSEEISSYRAMLGICRGRSLSEVAALLNDLASHDNLNNLAILLWAQGRDAECADLVGRISTEPLGYQGRVELDILKRLIGGVKDYADLAGQLLDPTGLRALAAHPELSESRRHQLHLVLDVVSPA